MSALIESLSSSKSSYETSVVAFNEARRPSTTSDILLCSWIVYSSEPFIDDSNADTISSEVCLSLESFILDEKDSLTYGFFIDLKGCIAAPFMSVIFVIGHSKLG